VRSLDVAIWAPEVAALIATGWEPKAIGEKHDLPTDKLERIFESPEFAAALQGHGPDAVTAFEELQVAAAAESAHHLLGRNLKGYLARLDELAMGSTLKPEKQADILMALVKYAAPADENLAEEEIRLAPSTMENIAKRHATFAAKLRGQLKRGNPEESES
jgi:hypothetical protein